MVVTGCRIVAPAKAHGSLNTIFELKSKDWQKVEITHKESTGPVFATTGARRDNKLLCSPCKAG
jgi:hypothetical protein